MVQSCDPREDDLIVMFREGVDTASFQDSVFWTPSCGNQVCPGLIADGMMFMEDGSHEALLGLSPWPFDVGEYRLYLVRVLDVGVVQTLASNPSSFRINNHC